MLKFRERQEPNSCWNKAEPEEPVFVLLGRDPAAEKAIMAWMQECIRLGKNTANDPQIKEAFALSEAMASYAEKRKPCA